MSLLQRASRIGKTYQNPVPTRVGGIDLALKVLPQYLFNREETEPAKPLGPFVTDPRVYAVPPASGLRVTWFGHSSLLVEIDGTRVLIDPVWDPRASPFPWMGPRRFYPPTVALDTLPPLDYVLISHDHYDHLGAQTVRQLATLQPQTHWVTSLGVGRRLRGFGVTPSQITELDWTESLTEGGFSLTAWPARHFSGRGLGDRFKSLWSSFVLQGPRHRVYYGADSGPWDGFAEIAARYDGFDLTMLEVGASSPFWPQIHLGPDAAVDAFKSMGARGLLMPIHWGLFNLALHGWRQPMERLAELAQQQELKLWSPRPGEPTEVVPTEALWSSWWQRKL